jgi:hypothetical protein
MTRVLPSKELKAAYGKWWYVIQFYAGSGEAGWSKNIENPVSMAIWRTYVFQVEYRWKTSS